jgi:transposase-like protein
MTLICRNCNESKAIKDGVDLYGVQRYRCNACKKRWISGTIPKSKLTEDEKKLIDSCSTEALSMRAIARILKRSLWAVQMHLKKRDLTSMLPTAAM